MLNRELFARLRRPRWSTLLLLIVAIWAAPRLWPHVGALVGMRMQAALSPTFDVRTLGGERVATDSLRGRVILVNVWATWCLPCRAEMPMLESTWRRHRAEGFVLLGASVDRVDAAVVRAFARERDVTYPIAIVDQGFIDAMGGVRGYPTSLLIGRDGRVRHKVVGPIGPLSLEPAIRRALADTTR